MTKAQIMAEVARRLDEASPSAATFWSTDDLNAAIDLGYEELSDETEWNEQWLDVDLLNDRPYYDLVTIIGASFLSLRPAFDRQTNRWLIPSTVRQLDAHDRRWERVTGEPQRLFLRGLRWLGLYPRIQSDVGQIKLFHTALPTPLADDDEPGFPDTFHYGLVEFALTELWAQDGEAALALHAWDAYLAIEAGVTAWLEGRAAGPMERGFSDAAAGAR
jgi:hypothetical protein